MTALFATMILGPRRGRFHDEEGRPLETPKEFPGHSISLQMLGAFILWFGWFGFNGGSALSTVPYENRGSVAALASANTALSAGMGGLTALFVNLWLLERYTGEPFFDLKYAMNGTLSGLVAITAGCGVVEPWAAVVIGFVAGLLYIAGSKGILKLRLDDAVDAIPCHLVNGGKLSRCNRLVPRAQKCLLTSLFLQLGVSRPWDCWHRPDGLKLYMAETSTSGGFIRGGEVVETRHCLVLRSCPFSLSWDGRLPP